jgi:hypothetical protein
VVELRDFAHGESAPRVRSLLPFKGKDGMHKMLSQAVLRGHCAEILGMPTNQPPARMRARPLSRDLRQIRNVMTKKLFSPMWVLSSFLGTGEHSTLGRSIGRTRQRGSNPRNSSTIISVERKGHLSHSLQERPLGLRKLQA